MTRSSAPLAIVVAIGLSCVACAADHDQPGAQAATPASGASPGCIAAGGGFLQAQLRGAVVADLKWSNAQMQCEGGLRPDGQGLRLAFVGQLPATGHSGAVGAVRQLRLIFGIDARDIAAGVAQAMPTNLTVILEGEQQLYATRGPGLCAVESLERHPLAGADSKRSRVHARGYCLGPATNLANDSRLLIPTFEFTGVADTEIAP